VHSERGDVTVMKKIQKKVCKATRVSMINQKCICREEAINTEDKKWFSITSKKYFQKTEETDINDFNKCVIRQTINDFYSGFRLHNLYNRKYLPDDGQK
jgi:hypothetical protein